VIVPAVDCRRHHAHSFTWQADRNPLFHTLDGYDCACQARPAHAAWGKGTLIVLLAPPAADTLASSSTTLKQPRPGVGVEPVETRMSSPPSMTGYMLCFAYRWYGQDTTGFVSIYQDPSSNRTRRMIGWSRSSLPSCSTRRMRPCRSQRRQVRPSQSQRPGSSTGASTLPPRTDSGHEERIGTLLRQLLQRPHRVGPAAGNRAEAGTHRLQPVATVHGRRSGSVAG